MSTGEETVLSSVYFTRTSTADYQQLCSLDVLGLEDRTKTNRTSLMNSANSHNGVRKDGMNQSYCGRWDTLLCSRMNVEAK